jgi:hypothetical protein
MMYSPEWYEYLYLPLFLFVIIGGLIWLDEIRRN